MHEARVKRKKNKAMRLIKYKPELAKKAIYFKNEAELVQHLRNNAGEEFNKVSDEYLVDESYQIGEWEEVSTKELLNEVALVSTIIRESGYYPKGLYFRRSTKYLKLHRLLWTTTD